MVTPKRTVFFVVDFLNLIIIMIVNFMLWKIPEWRVITIYVLISLFWYSICLFSFSGFFLQLDLPRRSILFNFQALLRGISSAIIGILISIFFIAKPHRELLFYHTLISGLAFFIVLATSRLLEYRFFWPKEHAKIMVLGEEPYNHLYIKEILSQWQDVESEILIVSTPGNSISQEQIAFQGMLPGSVRYLTINEAHQLLTSQAKLNAVILGQEPLSKELLTLIPICYQNRYSIMNFHMFYELVCRKVPLFQVGESWLAHISFQQPPREIIFVKRVFDVIFSLILIIVLFPIGLLVALAIKLETPGPALFIQERTGQGGQTFYLYKFRSMYLHPDDSNKWPHWEASLVTRVGHFIRKYGIDELPQLINILKGEMSFVGPRPARPLVTKHHIEKIPFYALSLALRPGITGWAQIHQGKDTGELSVLQKVRYNLYYAKKFSLLFDLEIIMKTFRLLMLGQKPS